MLKAQMLQRIVTPVKTDTFAEEIQSHLVHRGHIVSVVCKSHVRMAQFPKKGNHRVSHVKMVIIATLLIQNVLSAHTVTIAQAVSERSVR